MQVGHICFGSVNGWMDVPKPLDRDRIIDWQMKMISIADPISSSSSSVNGTSSNVPRNDTDDNGNHDGIMKELAKERDHIIATDKDSIVLGVIQSFPEAPTFINASSIAIGISLFRHSFIHCHSYT